MRRGGKTGNRFLNRRRAVYFAFEIREINADFENCDVDAICDASAEARSFGNIKEFTNALVISKELRMRRFRII